MLTHEETLSLLSQAQNGDNDAKNTLIERNMPLIKSIVKHYRNRQVEYEDLIQLGSLGLIKAINNFDVSFNVKFSTYAVPMIAGEIKRFIRDDGSIKISRAIKTLSAKINGFVEVYKAKNEKEPSVEEIAEEFSIDKQEVVYVMDSSKYPVSLQDKFDDENGKDLLDKLPSKENTDDLVDKLMLKDLIASLPKREKTIIILRYYRDKTQREIADLLGVSQVQVSRIESKILEKMKKSLS